MEWSRIGFGTYRIDRRDPAHKLALEMAVDSGISLIDTSSNYTDGRAEEIIGEVLEDRGNRDDVIIVSKYGYIQGHNMFRFKEGLEFPETVRYSPDCFHCIHPDFMRDQLERSLERLRTDRIDVFLIHNPEYFMTSEVKGKEPTEDEVENNRNEMLRRIGEAFEALEEEVSKGTIGSYGISSNSFSEPADSSKFLPYEPLIELAETAAEKAGRDRHSFSTVQMPGNLLETVGLETCAVWAKRNGLKVLINRPLNAFNDDGGFRLASYRGPEDYDEVLAKTLEMLEERELDNIAAEIRKLDGLTGELKSVFHIETVYHQLHRILLFTTKRFPEMEMPLLTYFHRFDERSKHLSSLKVGEYLELKGIQYTTPLEDHALQYLLDNENVTSILLGMREPAYVGSALRVLERNP